MLLTCIPPRYQPENGSCKKLFCCISLKPDVCFVLPSPPQGKAPTLSRASQPIPLAESPPTTSLEPSATPAPKGAKGGGGEGAATKTGPPPPPGPRKMPSGPIKKAPGKAEVVISFFFPSSPLLTQPDASHKESLGTPC